MSGLYAHLDGLGNCIIIGDGAPLPPPRMFSGKRSWWLRSIARRREWERSLSPAERAALVPIYRSLRRPVRK